MEQNAFPTKIMEMLQLLIVLLELSSIHNKKNALLAQMDV